MKNLSVFLITFLFTCISFSAILYISCSKAKDSCSGVSCLNSGSCVNGICNCPSGYVGSHCEKSSIYFKNNAYTS
ncbi:MAG: calcium-binding EGF-like domain-containing protein, partial [Bacteroidota bacterium]